MSPDMPSNTNETAYISFALIDALVDLLVDKGIITQGDFNTVLEAVAVRLSKPSNFDSQRGAEFIRNTRFGQE